MAHMPVSCPIHQWDTQLSQENMREFGVGPRLGAVRGHLQVMMFEWRDLTPSSHLPPTPVLSLVTILAKLRLHWFTRRQFSLFIGPFGFLLCCTVYPLLPLCMQPLLASVTREPLPELALSILSLFSPAAMPSSSYWSRKSTPLNLHAATRQPPSDVLLQLRR